MANKKSKLNEWNKVGNYFTDPAKPAAKPLTPPRISWSSSSSSCSDASPTNPSLTTAASTSFTSANPHDTLTRKKPRSRLVTRLNFDECLLKQHRNKQWISPKVTRTVLKYDPEVTVTDNSLDDIFVTAKDNLKPSRLCENELVNPEVLSSIVSNQSIIEATPQFVQNKLGRVSRRSTRFVKDSVEAMVSDGQSSNREPLDNIPEEEVRGVPLGRNIAQRILHRTTRNSTQYESPSPSSSVVSLNIIEKTPESIATHRIITENLTRGILSDIVGRNTDDMVKLLKVCSTGSSSSASFIDKTPETLVKISERKEKMLRKSTGENATAKKSKTYILRSSSSQSIIDKTPETVTNVSLMSRQYKHISTGTMGEPYVISKPDGSSSNSSQVDTPKMLTGEIIEKKLVNTLKMNPQSITVLKPVNSSTSQDVIDRTPEPSLRRTKLVEDLLGFKKCTDENVTSDGKVHRVEFISKCPDTSELDRDNQDDLGSVIGESPGCCIPLSPVFSSVKKKHSVRSLRAARTDQRTSNPCVDETVCSEEQQGIVTSPIIRRTTYVQGISRIDRSVIDKSSSLRLPKSRSKALSPISSPSLIPSSRAIQLKKYRDKMKERGAICLNTIIPVLDIASLSSGSSPSVRTSPLLGRRERNQNRSIVNTLRARSSPIRVPDPLVSPIIGSDPTVRKSNNFSRYRNPRKNLGRCLKFDERNIDMAECSRNAVVPAIENEDLVPSLDVGVGSASSGNKSVQEWVEKCQDVSVSPVFTRKRSSSVRKRSGRRLALDSKDVINDRISGNVMENKDDLSLTNLVKNKIELVREENDLVSFEVEVNEVNSRVDDIVDDRNTLTIEEETMSFDDFVIPLPRSKMDTQHPNDYNISVDLDTLNVSPVFLSRTQRWRSRSSKKNGKVVETDTLNISVAPDTLGDEIRGTNSEILDGAVEEVEPFIESYSSQDVQLSMSPAKPITTIFDIPSPKSSGYHIGTLSSGKLDEIDGSPSRRDRPTHDMDSAKKRKRPRKGGYAARLQKLLHRQKSASRIFQHEVANVGRVNKGHELRVDGVWSEYGRVMARCSELGAVFEQEEGDESEKEDDVIILVLDASVVNQIKKIQPKTVIKIYPPWQTLFVAKISAKLILNVTNLQVITVGEVDLEDAQPKETEIKILHEFSCQCIEDCLYNNSDCDFKMLKNGREFLEILFPNKKKPMGENVESESQLQSVSNIDNCDGTITELLANHDRTFHNNYVDITVQRVFRYKDTASSSSKGTEDVVHWSLLGKDSKGELCEVLLPDDTSVIEPNEIELGKVYRLNGFAVTKRIHRSKAVSLWAIICSISNRNIVEPSTSKAVFENNVEQLFVYIIAPSNEICGIKKLESSSWGNFYLRPQLTSLSDILSLPSTNTNASFSLIVKVLLLDDNRAYVTDATISESVKSYTVISLKSTCFVPVTVCSKLSAVVYAQDVQLLNGHLTVDKYSRLFDHTADGEVVHGEQMTVATGRDVVPTIADISILSSVGELVCILGNVVGVDDKTAFSWPSCLACSNDVLVAMEGGAYYCGSCRGRVETVTKMSLDIVVACATMPEAGVKVKLQQKSIVKLLPISQNDGDGYELSTLLGKEVGQLLCLVVQVGIYNNEICFIVRELPSD